MAWPASAGAIAGAGGAGPAGRQAAGEALLPPAGQQAAADTAASAPDSTAGDSLSEEAEAALQIGRVSVAGNTLTDSTRILRSFEVPRGRRYSDEEVRRGIRKLFALGLFDDVWVETLPHGDQVDVVIHVRERPRIAKVEFSGNQKRATSELEKKLFLHPGEVYSPTTTRSQVDSLLRYYHQEGFAQASVEAVPDTSAGANHLTLRFVVREGERVKITRIVFAGVTAFPEHKLRKRMKSKTKGFFGGGEVKEENFTEDKERLEAYYHSHGYRDMRVLSQDLEPGDEPRHLTLKATVEEGRLYRIGQVAWSGNQVLDAAPLQKLWQPRPGEKYDASRVEKVQGQAYAEYAERGYLYLGIEPRETVRDSVVDVTFGITEGRPSTIRMVNILGNRNTREKVIRREMAIHEGDRFKRSALVRTQGDISRLGLFEDVQVDFAPADSADVDINLKVKEKQVGTASAGAGYTSQSGVTGFLELGHNNVLGNGQSLSLHLERGGKRSDYYLSFTEPWFHDTPTLLGFSLFDTRRELDFYQEKRVGGSGRIGRPLPWPDYSRGSLSFSIEAVTVDSLGTLSDADRIALSGLRFGRTVLTNSLQTSFLRNSADNPFYPTKGTRLSSEDEFAGGPFGGEINFHKHRIEGRVYLPSFLKGITTMLRARVGLLGAYADQKSGAPLYETFRLGGGTTPDPLRGYDDYQVVPEKFDRLIGTVHKFIASIDSTTVPGMRDTVFRDTTTYTRVRYPGGHFMTLYTVEQQFPIVHPLHGVVFFDAGNVWDLWSEIRPFDLKLGAGIGFRLEIPLLGNVGLDYGCGFNRDDGPHAKAHFLIGNLNF